MAGQRVFDGTLDRRQRRLVDDMGDAAHGPAHRGCVADVSLDDFGRWRPLGAGVERGIEVLPPPGREVVQDDDGLAATQKRLDDVGADEAGPSGHEVAPGTVHHRPTPL